MILSMFLSITQTNVILYLLGNSKNKLNHSIVVLSLVLIQGFLYSLKNILRSSPLFPLKIGITTFIFIFFSFKIF